MALPVVQPCQELTPTNPGPAATRNLFGFEGEGS